MNDIGDKLREVGQEYGATTGRPRRCGWFDAFSVRYSAMVNGITKIAITKLDVLDSFDEIKICIGYSYEGKLLKTFPTDARSLECIEPIYETFEGWKTPLTGYSSYYSLPAAARRYIEAISSLTGTDAWIVSVGPRRDQTIFVP